jgi:hypothetical protein
MVSVNCLVTEMNIRFYLDVYFSEYLKTCSNVVPRTTSLDTTRPSTIFYRLFLIEHLSEGIGTLLEDGNVMPKHVGATLRN